MLLRKFLLSRSFQVAPFGVPKVNFTEIKKGNRPPVAADGLKKKVINTAVEVGKDVLIASAQSFGGQMAQLFIIACCVAAAATWTMNKYKNEVLEKTRRVSAAIKENKAAMVETYNAMLDKIKQSSSKVKETVDIDGLKEKGRDMKERLRDIDVDGLKEKGRDRKDKLASKWFDFGRKKSMSDSITAINSDQSPPPPTVTVIKEDIAESSLDTNSVAAVVTDDDNGNGGSASSAAISYRKS